MGCAQYSKQIITPVEGKLFTKKEFNKKMLLKNEKAIAVPEYLNEDFFVNVLEEGLCEMLVKVHEIKFDYGSNPGENYCSSIYRVLITFERKRINGQLEQLSVIIKTIPITSETQFLQDIAVFAKEKLTCRHVLPLLEILGTGDKFGADCLFAIKAPIQTIVFSDLKVSGFEIADRVNGLDWHHSTMVLEQLAKFHATSMVLAQKRPSIKRHYQKGLFCAETACNSTAFQQMFGGFLEQLIITTATWSGYEKITDYLKCYQENFGTITAKLGEAKPNDRYVVLNHGDLWTNNFMFGYDDRKMPKKPTKLIFVDFQLCFYGSPGCDLNFFLSTSVALDILQTRRVDLIKHYYNSFVQTLQYLRYNEIPTFDDLEYELQSRELYGLFGLFGFLPIVTMPKHLSEDNSIESLSSDEHKRKKLTMVFANPRLQAFYKYGLKRLEDVGAFENLLK